ncbi:MAG: hypothetical protein QM756_29675 [Polyangiaceae bacterium]
MHKLTVASVLGVALVVGWVAAQAQQTPGEASSSVSAEQLARPGMTWASLQKLPPLIGSLWVPEQLPKDEAAYLGQLAYPPLRDEYLADAQAFVAAMLAGEEELPTKTCRYDGMPRAAWYPYPIQFLYTAGYVMVQAHDVIRAASMVGLPHSPDLLDKDKLHSFDAYGEARGGWEGSTLVIDTIGTREDMDTFYGIPNDPDLHVIERYRLLDADRLERQLTIEAPTYFKQPWQLRTVYKRTAEASWATRFCLPAKQPGGTP